MYRSRYESYSLEKLAKKIYKGNTKDAYVYFNNDFRGYAIKNTLELKEVVKNVKR